MNLSIKWLSLDLPHRIIQKFKDINQQEEKNTGLQRENRDFWKDYSYCDKAKPTVRTHL